MTDIHQSRIARLQEAMEDTGTDAAILSIGPDLPYFTGYDASPSERITALVVPRVGEPTLYLPLLELPKAEGLAVATSAWGELEDPFQLIAGHVGSSLEIAAGDQMWSRFLLRFQTLIPHARWSGRMVGVGICHRGRTGGDPGPRDVQSWSRVSDHGVF